LGSSAVLRPVLITSLRLVLTGTSEQELSAEMEEMLAEL